MGEAKLTPERREHAAAIYESMMAIHEDLARTASVKELRIAFLAGVIEEAERAATARASAPKAQP